MLRETLDIAYDQPSVPNEDPVESALLDANLSG
jgi:hypothetical protein